VFRRFLGLQNRMKLVVAALMGVTLAAISYGVLFSHTQLNAASSHSLGAGNVSAAGTLLLTAAYPSADTLAAAPAKAHKPLTGCGGPTINLNNGMSQGTLSSKISRAPGCALIVFAAGAYNISAPINIPPTPAT